MFGKSLFIFVLSTFMVISNGYCEERRYIDSITSASNATAIPVAGTARTITKSYSVINNGYSTPIGVAFKASADGSDAVNVRIEALQSHQRPATEGTLDPTYQPWETVTTSVTDKNWHYATLDTVSAAYGAFDLKGQGSNGNSVSIEMKVIKQ